MKHSFMAIGLVLSMMAFVIGNSAEAAVITIADVLNHTGGATVVRDFTDVSAEESVYLVGTVTFDIVDTSEAFNAVDWQIDSTVNAYQWGQEYSSDNYSYLIPTPIVNLDSALTNGESHQVVLKISQIGANAGEYTLYFDPDLMLPELSNASVFTRTGGPVGTLQQLRFRSGVDNAKNTGQVDYTGFAVYTGDDTPFAPPSSIITIPDALDQTDAYSVLWDCGDISGEESVYLVGTMTFDIVDTSAAFDVVKWQIDSVVNAYQWGHAYGSDDIRFLTPSPEAVLDGGLTNGSSHTVVLKMSQTGVSAGDYTVFLDPNLQIAEGANTPVLSRTGGPTGTVEKVLFAGGVAGNTGQVDFTGFEIYIGDASPFIIPATGTAIVIK